MSTRIVPLDGSLQWEPFAVPGGTTPIELVRLHADSVSRAFTLLVRFPPGWERPSSGYYEAAEDVLVLEGAITINTATFSAGDWAYLPAGFLRSSSASPAGMLALARFSGPARWVESLTGATEEQPIRRRLTDRDALMNTPLGKAAPLRRGAVSSWLLTDPPPAGDAAPVAAELLDLDARAYAAVEAGAPLPAFAAPCFCRTFHDLEERR